MSVLCFSPNVYFQRLSGCFAPPEAPLRSWHCQPQGSALLCLQDLAASLQGCRRATFRLLLNGIFEWMFANFWSPQGKGRWRERRAPLGRWQGAELGWLKAAGMCPRDKSPLWLLFPWLHTPQEECSLVPVFFFPIFTSPSAAYRMSLCLSIFPSAAILIILLQDLLGFLALCLVLYL